MGRYGIVAIKILCLLVFLFATCPLEEQLSEVLKFSSKNYLSSIANFFGYSLKRLITNEASSYYYILRLFTKQRNVYYLGIAGFWIVPEFWLSVPGSFLVSNVMMNLVFSPSAVIHYWFEVCIASLFYCYVGMQFFLLYSADTQFMSWFLFLSYLSSYVISTYVIFPLNLTKRSITPGSFIYAVASCCLLYMAHTEPYMKWFGWTCQMNQAAMSLLLFQLLLGHGVGLAGSLSGFLLYYLQQSELIPAYLM